MEASIAVGDATGTKAETLRSMLKDGDEAVDELKFILMISQVLIEEGDVSGVGEYTMKSSDSTSGLSVSVKKASGAKCERCWFFDETVGSNDCLADDLCTRCDRVTTMMGFVKPPPPSSPEEEKKKEEGVHA